MSKAKGFVVVVTLAALLASAAQSQTSQPTPKPPCPTVTVDGPAEPVTLGMPVTFNDEKSRLVNFAKELQNDPSAQGYLVCYGGRRGRRDEAQRRCERALNYLSTHFRGIDAMRVVTVDGGFREEPTVELWVVPSGATPPATPTVDPNEVRPPTTQRRARPRGRR